MPDLAPKQIKVKAPPKSEESRARIQEADLNSFRERGFDAATMRDIANEAGVATGAAYYYFPSKDAIVMDFYRRSCEEMQPKIEAALRNTTGLEERLCALIRVKLEHFAATKGVLRALLRNGADPKHPLSPFSPQNKEIRDIDIAWFRNILIDCGVRIPKDLERHLPDVLWFFQMGVIFFWVIDESPAQARTDRLLRLSAKSVSALIRTLGGSPGYCGLYVKPPWNWLRLSKKLSAEMVTLEEITIIRAPIERCFDLARSVEVHLAGNVHWGEAAVATSGVTSGLVELGQCVTWRAKHFARWQQLTSEITGLKRPVYFRDTMIRGAFPVHGTYDHTFRIISPDADRDARYISLCRPAPASWTVGWRSLGASEVHPASAAA